MTKSRFYFVPWPVYTLLFFAIFFPTLILLFIHFSKPKISTKPANITPLISPTSTPPPRLKAIITKVVDGDTIVLSTGQVIRYIGIDTPEFPNKYNNYKKIDCFASEAKKTNSALVLNQAVELEQDVQYKDKYDRLLRYVYVEEEMVNDFLIRWGFARLDTIPPDTRYATQFQDAQKEAQANHRGLWKSCN